jgi:hypothetical protein
MPGTFSDSWKLTKSSFRMIREDRALLVFPLVGGLAALGVIALLLLGIFFLIVPLGTVTGYSNTTYLAGLALFLAAYVSMAFVSVYCTAALVGAATLKLNGQSPTAADGWKVARSRLGRLVVWSLLTATVGLVIQLVASRVRGIGGLLIGAVGGASWAVITYFMIPVLLYENERPWPALKRSGHLFVSSFGRTLVSNLALGLLIAAGVIVAVVVGIAGIVLLVGGPALVGIVLIGVALAIAIGVVLLGSAAEGILRAALYRYATTGQIDPGLMPAKYASQPPVAPSQPVW